MIIETDDEAEPEEKIFWSWWSRRKRGSTPFCSTLSQKAQTEWGALVKQGRVQVDGKTMTKKKSVEANAFVVVEPAAVQGPKRGPSWK